MTPSKPILLAEDNPRDLELMLAALEENQLADSVVVLSDGTQVLDYLHRRGPFATRPPAQPAVLLLDLKMPKLTGIEVLRAVKGDPRMRTLPVVVLTSSRETPDLAECYRLGANAYVVKPVEFTRFVDTLKQVGSFWARVNEPPSDPVLSDS